MTRRYVRGALINMNVTRNGKPNFERIFTLRASHFELTPLMRSAQFRGARWAFNDELHRFLLFSGLALATLILSLSLGAFSLLTPFVCFSFGAFSRFALATKILGLCPFSRLTLSA